jgi:hypothetical protein
MNFLLIFFIIIIVLSISYLFYRQNQYNNVLESFNNNTQSSLSTYFKNTVDYDSYATNQNMFHKNTYTPLNNTTKKLWDGSWKNTELNIYANFIQNNDKLIISLSDSSINLANASNYTQQTDSTCNLLNTFIGIGQLNNNLTSFNLIQVLCNNYSTTDLNLTVNNFSGNIVNNIIILHSLNSTNQAPKPSIQLIQYSKLSYYDNYAKSISPDLNTFPTIPDSEIIYETSPCVDSTPCMDKNDGLSLTTYNGTLYNACGTPTSSTDSTCSGTPTCLFYSTPSSSSINGIPSCSINSATYDYMNFAPLKVLSSYSSNSLSLCSHLNYFSPSVCNSVILCYVTNIGNVYTLNYNFFGSLPSESTLTVQLDMMDQVLNNTSASNANNILLPYYRNAITNGTNERDIKNALSFTNCVENSSSVLNYVKINSCKNTCKTYINNYNGPLGNNLLKPCLWQINYNSTNNVLNSCPIILSTNQLYNTPIKYAEFNDDGTTSLSLYSGGTKQQISFEKVNIISNNIDDTSNSFKYVTMTANIKTNNGLYLVPSFDNGGFINSSVIRLVNQPANNGKWLIIGLSVNNLDNLSTLINNISFTSPSIISNLKSS